jgi:DNA-binding response OmpR family regulator
MLINERHPLKTPDQILTERILHTLAQTPQGWTTRTELLRATGRPPTTAINQALDTLIQTHRIETTTTPPPKGTSGRHINAYRLTQHPPLSSRTA